MYLYYAVFSPEGTNYNVHFPDLDGAFTFGSDMQEALNMATDLLEGWLIVAENENDEIPNPTPPSVIKSKKNDLIIPISANTRLARAKHSKKYIKKTLSIPDYLNQLGLENNINFSQTLTDALKDKLGV